jgi:hypothetical protein
LASVLFRPIPATSRLWLIRSLRDRQVRFERRACS